MSILLLAQKLVTPEYGIKAGVNFATLTSFAEGNINTRTGFHIGALAHIHLPDMFALQPELLYSGQGATFPGNRTDRYNYFNIPVNIQYPFSDSIEENGNRIQTGPQLVFLIAAKRQTGDLEIDIKSQIKSLDFDWTAGYDFYLQMDLG